MNDLTTDTIRQIQGKADIGSNLRDRHPEMFPVIAEWSRVADRLVVVPSKRCATLRQQHADRKRRVAR